MSTVIPDFILSQLYRQDIVDEVATVLKRIIPAYEFEDRNDLGRILIELGAGLSEKDGVYANTLVNEIFPFKARDPESLSLHANRKLVHINTAQPSKVIVTLTLASAQVTDIVIQPYQLRITNKTSNPKKLFFENPEQITILAGETSKSGILMIEGESVTDTFYATGEQFEEIVLSKTNVILDITAGLAGSYGLDVSSLTGDFQAVKKLTFSTDSDNHFAIQNKLTGETRLVFGDGTYGRTLPLGEEVTIKYRIGGGTFVVPAGEVNQIVQVGGYAPSLFTSVVNPNASYGGRDFDSPEYLRKLLLVLSDEDQALMDDELIQLVAERVPEVARARVIPVNNVINVTIIPQGGGVATSAIVDDVTSVLIPRMPIGYDLQFSTPSYREINRGFTIWLKPTVSRRVVDEELRSLINSYLNPLTVDSNGNYVNSLSQSSFSIADLNLLLKSYERLYDYRIDDPTEDIVLNPQEVITHVNTKGTALVTTSAGQFKFVLTNKNSVVQNMVIEITRSGAGTITSTLVDDILGSSTLTYTLDIPNTAGFGLIANIVDFINNDPNLLLAHATTLSDDTEITGDLRLMTAEVLTDDETDDTSFTYSDTPSFVGCTFFDINYIGGV